MLIVKCGNPSCGAQLVVSKDRKPVCGRCNHPVAADTMKKAAARPPKRPSIFTRFRAVLFKPQLGKLKLELIFPKLLPA